MKHLIIAALAMGLLNSAVWAGQVDTECPWMREDTRRVNTKSNLDNIKLPSAVKTKAVKQ